LVVVLYIVLIEVEVEVVVWGDWMFGECRDFRGCVLRTLVPISRFGLSVDRGGRGFGILCKNTDLVRSSLKALSVDIYSVRGFGRG
jgi:hypothetical protein